MISDARPAQNAENGVSDRDPPGCNAAEGVAHGLFAVVILQQQLSWTLDDLEAAEALADEGLVEAE